MADEILIDGEAGVHTITLNRPDRLNALTSAIMAPLADACADAARDPAVGCVVVPGAGRGFCAGGDLQEGGADKAGAAPSAEERTHVVAGKVVYEAVEQGVTGALETKNTSLIE